MASEASIPNILELMLLDTRVEPTNLPMSLLKYITNNFSDDQQIGNGGFAVVYKGILQNGAVAVKKLSKTLDVDEAKFYQEVDSMLRVKHKNIVRFLGYCSDTQGIVQKFEGRNVLAEERKRFLCFEFVPLGSLDKFISDASRGLEWRTRYQIIKGICEGLHYLHQKRIVHLDLKPANILLDHYMIAKIADFGLSKCFDEKQTRAITLNVFGSLGYMAPEFHGGLITSKSDIYSLGVIILEILTGRKGYPEIDNVLESWGNRFGTGTPLGDTRLEQVRICAEMGIECTDFNPAKRPDTQRIIERLDKMEHTYGIIVADLCTSSETEAKRSPVSKLADEMQSMFVSYEAHSSSMLPSVEVESAPSPLHLVTIEPKGHGETGDKIHYHPGPSRYGELLDIYPLEQDVIHMVPNKIIDCAWTLNNRTDDSVAVWITPICQDEPCLHLWHPVPSSDNHVALDDDDPPCRYCFEIMEPHCTRVVAMRMENQARGNYGRSMFEVVMIIDPPSTDQLKSAFGRRLNLDITFLKKVNELGSGHVHRALLTASVCDPESCQISHYSDDDGGVGSVVPRDLFERLLLHRNDAACPARGFYTYEAFLAAAAAFPAFGATGSPEQRKREVAAFLGQTSRETTGGWDTAPDGPFSWGYCFKLELNPLLDYCDRMSQQWPCAPGKKYFGRGPFQLRYNYNYGPAGQAIGVDLLNNPDLVATDAVVSFKTALWFWMTPHGNKPSCHAVITGQWTPTAADRAAGRVPGYGMITNIICGDGPDPGAEDRVGFYKRYCDILGISYGSNLERSRGHREQ